MKSEDKSKTANNVITLLTALFGLIGAVFGIFQAQVANNLKNEVTNLQTASQQTNALSSFWESSGNEATVR